MFSKFSVIPKFCKFFNFQDNGMLRISRYIAPNRRCYSKIIPCECGTNVVLFRQEITHNISRSSYNMMKYKDHRYLNFTRHISSKDSKGSDKENSEDHNITKDKSQKKSIRLSKRKGSKKTKINCKRCKRIHLGKIDNEKVVKDVQKRHDAELPYNREKFPLKSEEMLLNGSKDFPQIQFPPNNIHIEFMESHSVKDFEMTKRPTYTNATQSDGEITNTQNAKSIVNITAIKNSSIFNSETEHLTMSRRYQKNLNTIETTQSGEIKMSKDEEIKLKNPKIEQVKIQPKTQEINLKTNVPAQIPQDTKSLTLNVKENKNSKLKAKSQTESKLISSTLNTEISKSFSNCKTNENIKSSKLISTDIRDPTVHGNRLIFPKVKDDKKTTYNRGKIQDLTNTPHGEREELPIAKPLENTPSPKVEHRFSKSTGLATSTIYESKNQPTVLFEATTAMLKMSPSGTNDPSKNDGINFGGKNIPYTKFGEKTSIAPEECGLKSTYCPKNMFGEYMSPEKLKIKSSTTCKKNKLNESKTSVKSKRERGGNQGGEGSNNPPDKQIPTAPPKDSSSRFWRTLSLTILPFAIGFTVYLFNNTGALEMIKKLYLTTIKKGRFTLKILPVIYENDFDDIDELNSYDDALEKSGKNELKLNVNSQEETILNNEVFT